MAIYIAVVVFVLILILQAISWKISLFFVSFSPLFIILSAKYLVDLSAKNKISQLNSKCISQLFKVYLDGLSNNYFWLVILILAITPPIIFLIRMGVAVLKKSSRVSLKIEAPCQLDDGIVSYVMTYIVPLTSLSFSSSFAEYTGNVLLFLMIMILYMRMDLVYLNPVLIILGFNIYKATIHGNERYILTRINFTIFGSLTKKTSVSMLKLNNNFYYYKKE